MILGKFIEDICANILQIWANLGNFFGKFAHIQTGLDNFALAQIFEGTLPNTIKNEKCTLDCKYHIIADELEEKKLYFLKQKDINDLNRELRLTKSNAELLTSRLKQWNSPFETLSSLILSKGFLDFFFFATEDGLCFCHNVNGLFDSIRNCCIPNKWRLFIDSLRGV